MLSVAAACAMVQLPLYSHRRYRGDWLVYEGASEARVYRSEDGDPILSNGLVTRSFRCRPGRSCATVGVENLSTEESMLRAVSPEAIVTIDGQSSPVGGLAGQPDRAYLDHRWLAGMPPEESPFSYLGFDVCGTEAPLAWNGANWPPKGAGLVLRFRSAEAEVDVRYEIYDRIPLIAKWIVVHNRLDRPIRIDRFESEILSLVEGQSTVDSTETWRRPPISVFTDASFGGSTQGVEWLAEPDYKTQVNYELKTPCRLVARPPHGPAVRIPPGGSLASARTYELFHDSDERERQGLAIRRMYRLLAPWTQDNPIMLHLTSTDPATVHQAIDQAADCGFEMIVISFWSGLNMEDLSPANVAKFKGFADYAHAKGLRLGGYSLLASRSIDKKSDVVNPKPIFGASPCLGSEWGQNYFKAIRSFIEQTGFDLLEHDGSYPGDTCASTLHPGHEGYEDSQWTQFQTIASFYRWCRARGVFLNVPDVYFLSGSNKTGMGYRESNWSLPREQQHVHARQNLFDGTWEKTPSMGWMMVPLVEYQGGGPAATIEPLREHLADYALHFANNFGYGAQACYRGPRLYDAPETREVVKKWVQWFKDHRAILESDVIHVRRANGQDLDVALHVNPQLPTRAMAVVYNPLDREQESELVLQLRYSGLRASCSISREDGRAKRAALDGRQMLAIKVKVKPRGWTWLVIRP